MIEILEARIAPAVLLSKLGQLANSPTTEDLITTDASGNIIVVGKFTGTIDVDLGPGVSNLTTGDSAGDIYVASYAPDFSLLWAKTWGGTGEEHANDVKVDSSGNVFVTGQFSSASAGFGGTGSLSATVAAPQAFVFKMLGANGNADTGFSSGGQLTFGNGTAPSSGNALLIDHSDTLVVGGDFKGSGAGINGSGGFTADGQNGSQDGFIIRLDPTSGTLDPDFGGTAIELFPGGTDSVFRLQVNSDDLFVGVKTITPPAAGGTPLASVLRLSGTNFSPISTYGSGGFAPIGSGDADSDFVIDETGQVVVAQANGGIAFLIRLKDADGSQDTTYGTSGAVILPIQAGSVSVAIDQFYQIYVAGETPSKNYLARVTDGVVDSSFGLHGVALFGGPPSALLGKSKVGLAVDPSGNVFLRDAYTGNPDLDPSANVRKTPARNLGAGSTLSDGFLIKLDPSAVSSGQSYVIDAGTSEANGLRITVTVKLAGPGFIHVNEKAEGGGDIDSIELFNTTLASKLTVTTKNADGGRTIGQILTHDSLQSIGSIVVDPFYTLGNGNTDTDPELLVTGKITNISLGNIRGNSLIRLGRDLPYNIPNDTTTPDTYNNRPNFKAGNILGTGVVIDVTGDGVTAGGVGGGGFGSVVINSWVYDGLLKTTQSIGSFTVLHDDFYGRLEVDKFGLGESTTANVGSMTVQEGDWGSSGTDIEGNLGVFNVEQFLAGAAITAGSVGAVNADGFNGTLTLTDAIAKSTAVFTVANDFTGKVVSNSPLKRLNIKGDFMGSLTAPSIAAITAYSFIGTTVGELDADPTQLNITTTAGLLGLIRAKSGVIKDYVLKTPGNFTGMTVILNGLVEPTVGIENVKVDAATIGPITVLLNGKTTVPGLDLTGISNSQFTATGKMANITVKVAGGTGINLGLQNAKFSGDSIGNVLVSVAKGKGGAPQAQAVNDAEFTSAHNLGAVTVLGDATTTQASQLDLWAGGKIGPITVKSKTASLGTLADSHILAGQSLDLSGIVDTKTLTTRLAAASLGPVNVGGSVNSTTIAAGGLVGVVNVGGGMAQSAVLGGALLGANRAVGGGDDIFHRAGQIASVVVKGSFDRSTLSAGVNATDGIFGDLNDVAGDAIGSLTVVSAIKSISLGIAPELGGVPALAHSYAIQAGKIGKLVIAGQATTDFTNPALLAVTPSVEGADDIVVRLV